MRCSSKYEIMVGLYRKMYNLTMIFFCWRYKMYINKFLLLKGRFFLLETLRVIVYYNHVLKKEQYEISQQPT